MKALLLTLVILTSAVAQTVNTGNVNGLMAAASRPESGGKIEIEAADDFILDPGLSISGLQSVNHATFTGLLTGSATVADIEAVTVEIYRVFPNDSASPSGNVPTRVNSPADNALDDRSTLDGNLKFTATVLNSTFAAANSVLNGIHPKPDQTTMGEGPVTGTEVFIDVTFTTPFDLPADHLFFVPQVQVNGAEFMWLSSVRPIVSPGIPFAPDLQAWIRNENLDPDWLRIGTDIVGGATPPTFNMTFTLDAAPESSDILFLDFFFGS